MKKELVMITALLLLLSGCGSMNSSNKSPSTNQNENINTQSVKQQDLSNNHKDTIAHLEELAKSVEGVNNAHVVIMGNNAIVGIDVNADLERSRVGVIKYSVAEAFRNDTYGVNAIVTADMDLGERIKEIGADISAGHPVMGIAEELSDIVGRIIPQVPADLMPSQKDLQYKATNNDKTYNTPDELVKDYEHSLKGK
ncbi:MAG: YhcN/YlaJ family sporulation lipoprotein [Candidatus Pristimantibacillus lignocellulolyticus]|uniref:YhcN/YlaJ family sporulation lipoprotein n=1 Tax=Candidatus Pristimantibacillus lignocellulolyticus TaxID=2994561 RepID=A0A9J6ZAS5_9BACL|nr:MAG: YhcN/YlaJ family sporulation lipoprotein [Candidatus Pristimantibacillus lignocellulolyticus]